MAFKSTEDLIVNYGEDFRQGNLSQAQLEKLLRGDAFKATNPYNHQEPTTELNYSRADSINDFVRTIGPQISDKNVHNLTRALLAAVDIRDENTFLRMEGLEKSFLAYEMARQPAKAEEHFTEGRLVEQFPTAREMLELRDAILDPVRRQFVSDTLKSSADEILANPKSEHYYLFTILQRHLTHENNAFQHAINTSIRKFLEGNSSIEQFLNNLSNTSPELTPDKRLEIRYSVALVQLQKTVDDDKVKSELSHKTQQLIDYVMDLKEEGKEPVVELTKALEATNKVLKDGDVKEYNKVAKTMEGKPSIGLKILGGLMMGIGVLVMGAGAAMAATGVGVVAGGVTVVAGAGVLAAGLGVFSKSKATGLSKKMSDVKDEIKDDSQESGPAKPS